VTSTPATPHRLRFVSLLVAAVVAAGVAGVLVTDRLGGTPAPVQPIQYTGETPNQRENRIPTVQSAQPTGETPNQRENRIPSARPVQPVQPGEPNHG
jgi:hypothetical protein